MLAKLSKDDMELLVQSRHYAPRSHLGFHEITDKNGLKGWIVRVFEPEADAVALFWQHQAAEAALPLKKIHDGGLFEILLQPLEQYTVYKLVVDYRDGNREIKYDQSSPYL